MRYNSIGRKSIAVDVTSASWALSGQIEPIGIQCNVASTITGALIGDSAETAWILPVGYTPLAFASINTSSTTKSGYKIIFA